jgi:WD40 repeat protein
MLVWKGHKGRVRSLAFSPDGRFIVTTAGASKFVWLWDATTGKLVRTLSAPGAYRARMAIVFPDGQHVAAQFDPGGIWVWAVATGAWVAGFENLTDYSDAMVVSPDGSRLLACRRGQLVEWDEPTRITDGPQRPPDRTHPVLQRGFARVGFSPGGTYFCVAEWQMHLLDPTNLTSVRTLQDPAGYRGGASATAFAFTPDDGRIAVAFGLRAAIWQLDQPGAKPVHIHGHGNLVRAVGFLPGGSSVLTAGMDGTVRLWDASTGAEQRVFDWGIGKIQVAAVSPDGLTCAAGSDDGQLVVWDVDT